METVDKQLAMDGLGKERGMLSLDNRPVHVDTPAKLLEGKVAALKMPLDKFEMDGEMLAIASKLVVVVGGGLFTVDEVQSRRFGAQSFLVQEKPELWLLVWQLNQLLTF